MTQLLVLAVAFCGFCCLAIAMDRHHRLWFGRSTPHSRRVRLRIAGAAFLVASCVLAVSAEDGAMAIVRWAGSLSVCALTLAFFLPFVARRS